MSQSAPIISVRDLKKIYYIGTNQVHALDGISFDIPRGTFLEPREAENRPASICSQVWNRRPAEAYAYLENALTK